MITPSPTLQGPLISGRYLVRSRLGSGGTGTVYRVHDEVARGEVALKVIKPERLDELRQEAFGREFQELVRLRHPQIATAFDFGYTHRGHLPYYTREYIAGVPLPPGPPRARDADSPRRFLQPVLDLLDALQYLHEHGILHLDVHAGNLIVAEDDTRGAVLIDFGIPRPFAVSSAMPTLPYRPSAEVAPEVLGGGPVVPATDLYAVGRLLLYRLSSGRTNGPAFLPQEIADWGARCTLELERIIQKALRPDPDDRFASAREFRDALLTALGQSDPPASRSEPRDLLVGRDAELDTIEDRVASSARGEATVSWIWGPSGCGKSRLLTEVKWRAQVDGLEVHSLQFAPAELTATPIAGALRSAGARTPRDLAWLSPLDTEHGGSTRERARRAAEAYFAEPGTALTLLLDDFENADRESRVLATALLEEGRSRETHERGLALVVSSTRAPPRSLGVPESARYRLRALRRSDSRQMLLALVRPLKLGERYLKRAISKGRGLPARLRRLAAAIRRDHATRREVPEDAPLPDISFASPAPSQRERAHDDSDHRILTALAQFARAVSPEEVAAACELSRDELSRCLRRLARAELVVSSGRGSRRRHTIADRELAGMLRSRLSRRSARTLHRRAVEALRERANLDLNRRESLCRHLLSLGRQREGREEAHAVVEALAGEGRTPAAASLLEEMLEQETSRKHALALREQLSDLHGSADDHVEGIAVLRPLWERERESLSRRELVRVARRLGVHYHRAGKPRRALPLFRRCLALGQRGRDTEDLILVHSELAELHTFHGEFDRAEESCQSGLALLDDVQNDARFRTEMEITLRASTGHLELRRMRADHAEVEFEAALALATGGGHRGLRALILNNLGVIHNQRNRFGRAASCFRQAERLLRASGERSARIQISCNLAVIAAKRGRAAEARREIEEAARLQRAHAGERLEFFLSMSRALVHHLLGEVNAAIDGFHEAIPIGARFGDRYLLSFGEIYLSEACIAAGRYAEARETLVALLERAEKETTRSIARLAACRLLFLSTLTGHRDDARRARAALAQGEPDPTPLLEAWNQLFLAFAQGDDTDRAVRFRQVAREFEKLEVPLGERLARIGLLGEFTARGDLDGVLGIRRELDSSEVDFHRGLRALEPLARAAAEFRLGDLDACERWLHRAAGAVVGAPLLEIDGAIERLHVRLAERRGDREAARHHLRRALQARDLLAQALPPAWRQGFLSRPDLHELEASRLRLERAKQAVSTPRRSQDIAFEGLVGRSAPMRRVFEQIERYRDVDLPAIVTGETGTGKDLVARALHEHGPRRDGPFHALHCASLPPELFESELFGCEAGAFSGAETARAGLIEHLAGGTLLLDEITQLAPRIQGKLLQVIDRRVFRPLGSLDVRPVEVRFLASTGEEPQATVDKGALRRDLYFRLAGFEIRLPPLRERAGDIPELVAHFFELHARRLGRVPPALSAAAIDRLLEHDWPGNVRELEALTMRLVVSEREGATIAADAVRKVLGAPRQHEPFSEALLERKGLRELRRDLEAAWLRRAFRSHRGNMEAIAASLDVRRARLYAWFKELDLDIKELRAELEDDGPIQEK